MSGPRLLTPIGRYYCLHRFSGSDVRAIELEASWTLLECRDSGGPLFEVADIARDNVLLVIGRIVLPKADIEAG